MAQSRLICRVERRCQSFTIRASVRHSPMCENSVIFAAGRGRRKNQDFATSHPASSHRSATGAPPSSSPPSDLGPLLAALGAQLRHAPAYFSFLLPRQRRSSGGSGTVAVTTVLHTTTQHTSSIHNNTLPRNFRAASAGTIPHVTWSIDCICTKSWGSSCIMRTLRLTTCFSAFAQN